MDGLKLYDKVKYANDDTDSTWVVIRLGDTFVYLTDKLREYPKAHCFAVPRGTLRPRNWNRDAVPVMTSHAAPVHAKVDFGQTPPRTLPEFLTSAEQLGASPAQLAELSEVWHQPAPNNGVRIMRMRNFFKNHLSTSDRG